MLHISGNAVVGHAVATGVRTLCSTLTAPGVADTGLTLDGLAMVCSVLGVLDQDGRGMTMQGLAVFGVGRAAMAPVC